MISHAYSSSTKCVISFSSKHSCKEGVHCHAHKYYFLNNTLCSKGKFSRPFKRCFLCCSAVLEGVPVCLCSRVEVVDSLLAAAISASGTREFACVCLRLPTLPTPHAAQMR